tara:strand:+ start:951 stop:1487 length:537 start_codon:yes stop_codon:yes gene_type:complete
MFKKAVISTLAVTLVAAGCTPKPKPTQDAYWQRIEAHSALYMTGPKAQQQLEQTIAGCVREVDELVRLKAIRETTPPDTHYEYHSALNESGDLAAFETPKHHKDIHVDHSEYYDFESCMRSEGWERVRAVRYQVDKKAQQNYKDVQDIRKFGVKGHAAEVKRMKIEAETKVDYQNVND